MGDFWRSTAENVFRNSRSFVVAHTKYRDNEPESRRIVTYMAISSGDGLVSRLPDILPITTKSERDKMTVLDDVGK